MSDQIPMISSIPPPVDPFNFASHHPSWSTPTYGAQSSLFTDGSNKMNQSRSPTYGNPVESPRTGSSDGSIGGLMYSEGNASGSASPSISLPLTSHQEASGAIFSKTTPSMAAINSGRRASSPAALYLPNVSTIKNGQSSQHSLPGYPGEENDASSSNLSCPPGYLYSFRPAADSGTPYLGAWPSMTHPHLRTVQSDPNAGLLNGATSAYPAQRFEMGLMGLPEYPEYFENTGSDAMSMMHNMAYDPYQVKHRKRTSPEQLAVLETAFEENSKPSAVVRKAMADQLGMTPRSVQVWFQNRRQKRKMLERKRQEGDTLEQAEASDNLPAQAYPALLHIRTNTGTFPLDTTKTHSQPGLDGWSSRYPVNHPTPSSDHPGGSHPTPYAVISTEEERRSVESSLRPTKTTVTPSQARRGSLPYPTPINTSMNSLSNHSFVARGSNSGSEKATRSQIPLHLAVSMGGRRASLPNNSRSISLGSFKPPRTGNNPAASGLSQVFQRELSPIADRDQPDAHPSYSGEGGPLSYFEHLPNWSGGSSALSGPLPNPDYSFGFTDHTPLNSATLNDASLPLVTPGLEYPSAQSAMGYRDRMGSLASVMSQGSQATSSDTTEWAGTPYLYGNMPFGFDAAKIIQPEDGNHLSLPYGFDADTRRASAPADLLQNLNFLEVQSKRSSPLNPNSAESGNLSNHLDGSMAKLMTEAVDPSFILPVNTYSRGAADLGRCDAYQNYQGCTNRSFSSTPTISPVPAAREGKSKESGAANDATAAWGGPWQ